VQRRHSVAVSAATIIVAAALAAVFWPFSPGRAADGPFGPSEATQNAECIPIPGWVITYGFESVRNTGSSDATIQKIGYVRPHNLRVLDVFVVPVHGSALYGGEYGYPPKWMLAERSLIVPPVKGARIDDYTNVIVVTKLTGKTGHADAVYLDYKENGRLYRYRTITSLTVKHGVRAGQCA
jgi:hypothetical protein